MRFLINPEAQRGTYTADEARVVSMRAARRALARMQTWPGYAATPLLSAPRLATDLGIGALYVKDESSRFGLGSFKALGGAYAAGLAVQRLGSNIKPTLCCATDGNHGRSVAFGAQRMGCRCVIFMHAHAPEHKAAAMRAFGAEVSRLAGNYDDSVRHAKRVAAAQGWLVISDTTDDPYDPIAADVMHGYGVMVLEMLGQLEDPPTHLIMQAGVGGFAAAIAGCFADLHAAERPTTLIVEPETAACIMESVRCGTLSPLSGDLITNMAMLSCGETSAPAWVVLQRRADALIAVSDTAASAAAELLRSRRAALHLATTPSGAAGLAGLIAAAGDPAIAAALHLNEKSHVVVFMTEGDDERSPLETAS